MVRTIGGDVEFEATGLAAMTPESALSGAENVDGLKFEVFRFEGAKADLDVAGGSEGLVAAPLGFAVGDSERLNGPVPPG
ncbi:hypothetical protein N9042_01290 [bacterium]|nr:hypothetical protein [bacterium]